MTHKQLNRALLASAAMLLMTTGAYAQSPNANPNANPPGKGHSADATKRGPAAPGSPAAGTAATASDKTADKVDDKKDKVDDKKDKVDDKKDKAEAKGKDPGDRATRKAKQLEEQKNKLRTALKGPMDEATKQELRHHAERVARLERIKSLAETAKDADGVDRAIKLLAKENARHDKWMEKHVTTPTGLPAAAPAAAPAAQPTTKEGAK